MTNECRDEIFLGGRKKKWDQTSAGAAADPLRLISTKSGESLCAGWLDWILNTSPDVASFPYRSIWHRTNVWAGAEQCLTSVVKQSLLFFFYRCSEKRQNLMSVLTTRPQRALELFSHRICDISRKIFTFSLILNSTCFLSTSAETLNIMNHMRRSSESRTIFEREPF